MPTNLPPEALAAQQKYQDAQSLPEKIQALQEYIAKIPKHKGTEKLLALLKSKLAKLREELNKQRKVKKSSGISMNVKKEGAGQLILVGLPNVGKSSLLNKLTSANAKVADYPFTTKMPEIGMLNYEGVLIQTVEAPAIFPNMSSSTTGRQILTLIRNADIIGLVIDLSMDPNIQMKTILNELKSNGILLNVTKPPIKVEKTGSGGIQVFGADLCDGSVEDIKDILRENGLINAVVNIYGKISLQQIAEVLDESIVYRPAFIIANKGDLEGSSYNFNKLTENYGTIYKIIAASAKLNKGLDKIAEEAFRKLRVIRIYTRDSEGKTSKTPIILPENSTVEDVTERLPPHLLKKFKYAKIFGPSAKFDGEKVGLDHVLKDKDIIQIFTK